MVLADDAIAMFLHFTELTGSKVIFDILPAFSSETFFLCSTAACTAFGTVLMVNRYALAGPALPFRIKVGLQGRNNLDYCGAFRRGGPVK